MKKHISLASSLLVCLLTCLLCMTAPAYGLEKAVCLQAAENFLVSIGSTDSPAKVIPITDDTEKILGYRLTLSDGGYLIVSASRQLTPIKGYSLTTSWENLPQPYREFLLTELVVPETIDSAMSEDGDINGSRWSALLDPASAPDSAQATSPILLTSTWNQTSPYNSKTPKVSGVNTVTGCVQTAIAQIMMFHQHPSQGAGVYTHSWNGQTLIADMNRPFNWSALGDAVSGADDQYVRDEVGYLMRDLGILNEASFGTSGTSAYLHTYDFARAFGYGTDINTAYSSNGMSAFLSAITTDIDKGLPVYISLPGHAVVGDGYSTSSAGTAIHLNMGWGGSYDEYYYLDSAFTAGSYTYPSNHSVYYNIQPCSGSNCASPSVSQQGRAPVITDGLYDAADTDPLTYRVNARDMDGDAITISAVASQSALGLNVNGNLLTITPTAQSSYSLVRVTATSDGGSDYEDIGFLSTTEPIGFGSEFSLPGTFTSSSDVHSFKVYLSGEATISGYRGYSNQAFYIWVLNSTGGTAAASSSSAITQTFSPGMYTVKASLSSQSGYSYYSYNASYADFAVTVTGSGGTVEDVADALGIPTSGTLPSGVDMTPIYLLLN